MIKLLILDIDGVMTDGRKYYDRFSSVMAKSFNDKDFTAIKRFQAAGIFVVFLSGDKNINEAMAKNRNIPFYHSWTPDGGLDKASFVPLFESVYKVSRKDMCYVGDDLFDIPIMQLVGYKFCPEDAIWEVANICIPLPTPGGQGVVAKLYCYCQQMNLVKDASYSEVVNIDKKETK